MNLRQLPEGVQPFTFSITINDGEEAVIGPAGYSGVTHAIEGLPAHAQIGHWQVFADATNTVGVDYKKRSDAFVAAGDDNTANYLTLAADLGDVDDTFAIGAWNQTMRLRPSGEANVKVTGRVLAKVTR